MYAMLHQFFIDIIIITEILSIFSNKLFSSNLILCLEDNCLLSVEFTIQNFAQSVKC